MRAAAYLLAMLLLLLLVFVLARGRGDDSVPAPVTEPGGPDQRSPLAVPPPLPGSPPAPPDPDELVEEGIPGDVDEPPRDRWSELDESLQPKPDEGADRLRESLGVTKVFVDFRKTPLQTVAEFLQRQTHVPVTVEVVTLEERAREELLVDHEAETTTVQAVLDDVTKQLGLVWWIEGDTVHIAPTLPREPFVTIAIPVDGLTVIRLPLTGEEMEFEADAAADVIREQVDPWVWDGGGDISLDEYGKNLLLTAPARTGRKVIALLRKLAK